eukprot:6680-Chlamydomonas_euryale.AAC.2
MAAMLRRRNAAVVDAYVTCERRNQRIYHSNTTKNKKDTEPLASCRRACSRTDWQGKARRHKNTECAIKTTADPFTNLYEGKLCHKGGDQKGRIMPSRHFRLLEHPINVPAVCMCRKKHVLSQMQRGGHEIAAPCINAWAHRAAARCWACRDTYICRGTGSDSRTAAL